MNTQPEALRLADWLDDQYDPTHNQENAAAELRRLSAVEAQRDALLETAKTSLCVLCALLDANDWHPNMRKDIAFAIEGNRYAIAAVEGDKI